MSHAVAQKLRIPDCEGYLHKKGHLVPSWKRRYFALYGSELSYFESEAACSRMRSQGKVFKGNLLKGQVKVVQYLEWSASLKPHSFMLQTSNHNKKKTFYLIADDEEGRKMWARAIRIACGQDAVPEDVIESSASEDLNSYTVSFRNAPVGIEWASALSGSHSTSGLDKSAVVEKISGASKECGKVQPGHLLVSVNGTDVSEMNFKATMKAINQAEFPVSFELFPGRPVHEQQDHRFMSGDFRTWAVTLLKASGGTLQAASKADHHHLVLAVDDEGIKAFNLQSGNLKKKVEEMEVTLDGEGQIGLDMTTNFSGKRIYGANSGRRYSGLDFSAVVQTVSGLAKDTQRIFPGFFLTSVNGQDTTKINFAKTMRILHSAPRPLTLRFLATYSPVHIAKVEFSSRLISSWPFHKVMHWEASKNTFNFDNYEGDGSPVEHFSFSTREAQEIQDFLEAKTKVAGNTQAGDKVAPAFAIAVHAATNFGISGDASKQRTNAGTDSASGIVLSGVETSSAAAAAAAAAAAQGDRVGDSAAKVAVQGFGFESQAIIPYEISLGEGPLGLQLIDCTANFGRNLSAVVDKVTGAAATSGHFLFSVNNTDVTCLTFKETMSCLKSATRPLTLRFWTVPPTQQGKYKVTFSAPLAIGVGFCRSTNAECKSAMVDRVVGSAKDSGMVSIGHLLLSVNGSSTQDLSFEQTMEVVNRSVRPIVLEFQMNHKSSRDTFATPTYQVTFGPSAGTLGIAFAEVSGASATAVESLHPSGAAATSRICVGDIIRNVNGIDTRHMDFQATMQVLKETSRPITLEFQGSDLSTHTPTTDGPTAGSGFHCYTLQDPTGSFPGEVWLLVGDAGVQIVATSRANVCFWPWQLVNSWQPALQSDDPGDMEIVKIGVTDFGVFTLECNDAHMIARAFQAQVDVLLAQKQQQQQAPQQLSSGTAESILSPKTQLAGFPAVVVEDPSSSLPSKVVLVPFVSSLDVLDGAETPPSRLQRLQYTDISKYGMIPGSGALLPQFRLCVTTLSGSEVTYSFETSNAAQLQSAIRQAIQDLLLPK